MFYEGWKKDEAEQKHDKPNHSKSIQNSKSDRRIQNILPFCIFFFRLVPEKELSNSFLVTKLEGNKLVERVTSFHNKLC